MQKAHHQMHPGRTMQSTHQKNSLDDSTHTMSMGTQWLPFNQTCVRCASTKCHTPHTPKLGWCDRPDLLWLCKNNQIMRMKTFDHAEHLKNFAKHTKPSVAIPPYACPKLRTTCRYLVTWHVSHTSVKFVMVSCVG